VIRLAASLPQRHLFFSFSLSLSLSSGFGSFAIFFLSFVGDQVTSSRHLTSVAVVEGGI
jgi:hypothetical protein